jgi:hypothetical protein
MGLRDRLVEAQLHYILVIDSARAQYSANVGGNSLLRTIYTSLHYYTALQQRTPQSEQSPVGEPQTYRMKIRLIRNYIYSIHSQYQI